MNALLRRRHSPLRCLEIDFSLYTSLDVVFPERTFENFLHAAGSLERLSIQTLDSQQLVDTLVRWIPQIKVSELEFSIDLVGLDRDFEQTLLDGVKDNFFLRSFKAKQFSLGRHEELIEEDEQRKRLEFYMDRNKRVSQWVEDPSAVSRKVWPEALQLADRKGHDSLFLAFRALAMSGVCESQKKRKRKRPQFFKPS